MYVCVCHSTYAEHVWQSVLLDMCQGISSPLPPCMTWGPASGHEARWQVSKPPKPAESSHCPHPDFMRTVVWLVLRLLKRKTIQIKIVKFSVIFKKNDEVKNKLQIVKCRQIP